MSQEGKLLPPNALSNIQLGISVSDSPDLARLGLLETHFRLALAEIARCVLVSGGYLTYGGHLLPDGYTTFLIQEIYRYSRRDRPLHICLSWQEHRRLSLGELKEESKELGLHGLFIFLDPEGKEIDPTANRSVKPVPEIDKEVCKRSLTAMRHYMGQHTHGRIFLGGKRQGFQGDMPGVLEESLIALQKEQPIYLAGGFGGVTADVIRTLGIDNCSWLGQNPEADISDIRLIRGLEAIGEFKRHISNGGLRNGLNEEENKKLASTHRPSEVATLISLGLGRRFKAR